MERQTVAEDHTDCRLDAADAIPRLAVPEPDGLFANV
jgi:hypothetical protein